VNVANASGQLFNASGQLYQYAGLGAPQAQRPVTFEELRALQFAQRHFQGEQGFSTALALMDDQAMEVRDTAPIALMDGRLDEPPAFPDADPYYDEVNGYDPPSLLTTYQPKAPPGAQSKAFPSAPGAMSKASMAPPPKAKAKATYATQRSRNSNLTRAQYEALRWQQQGFMWRRNPDDQV
jgi:hypothetical protein